jgi:hypothetical protein
MYIFAKFVTDHIFLQIRDKINIKNHHFRAQVNRKNSSECKSGTTTRRTPQPKFLLVTKFAASAKKFSSRSVKRTIRQSGRNQSPMIAVDANIPGIFWLSLNYVAKYRKLTGEHIS